MGSVTSATTTHSTGSVQLFSLRSAKGATSTKHHCILTDLPLHYLALKAVNSRGRYHEAQNFRTRERRVESKGTEENRDEHTCASLLSESRRPSSSRSDVLRYQRLTLHLNASTLTAAFPAHNFTPHGLNLPVAPVSQWIEVSPRGFSASKTKREAVAINEWAKRRRFVAGGVQFNWTSVQNERSTELDATRYLAFRSVCLNIKPCIVVSSDRRVESTADCITASAESNRVHRELFGKFLVQSDVDWPKFAIGFASYTQVLILGGVPPENLPHFSEGVVHKFALPLIAESRGNRHVVNRLVA
ncbi:hypothetical protein R3P38DRAFT_2768324 [Favolaschia claudopus]|uniref:Uncharacterized protein n=1 Tax=Favolaschia claudopus TaxID=2862362 RepID=A0AAW0CSS3_9AGAR